MEWNRVVIAVLALVASGFAILTATQAAATGEACETSPGSMPSNINLSDCVLTGIDLTGVNLSSANLTSATLTDATLTATNLGGATLTAIRSGGIIATTPPTLPGDWRLTSGYLIGPGANLENANLTNANLTGANLQNAILTNANLTGANLQNANLTNADLSLTNLKGATLTGANLTDAVIFNTTVGAASTALVYRGSGEDGRGSQLKVTAYAGTSESLAIPGTLFGRSVTEIADFAFLDVSTLTGPLSLPSSVQRIGGSAFVGTSFTSLDLGSSLISIGDGAFYNVSTLTGPLVIPPTTVTIGNSAFYGTNLNGTLGIPASITSLGYEVFRGTKFTSLTFADGSALTAIPNQMMQDVTTLRGNLTLATGITTIGTAAFENTGFNGTLSLPIGITSIANAAFQRSNFTGTLTIPNTVNTIGESAFVGTSFTSLDLGSSVTSIGSDAFYEVSTLNSGLTIPNTTVTIGNSAFYGTNLNGPLVIPASITSLGYEVFRGTKFTSLTFADDSALTAIPNQMMQNVTTLRGNLTLATGITTIGTAAFEDTGFNGTLSLPTGVTSIGYAAFLGTNFTGTLTIPNTVITIGESAFQQTRFTGLSIGSNVTEIPRTAFYRSNLLTGSLSLPDSVERIGESAFDGTSFTSLDLGSSVTSIGPAAFYGVSTLNGGLTIPNTTVTIGDSAFFGTHLDGALVIPASISSLGDNVFYGTKFTSLTFADDSALTTIPNQMMQNVTTLRGNLTLPTGITTIGTAAFENTGFNGTLSLPTGVTSIGNAAFLGTNFTGTLTIPNTVNIIGEGTFQETRFTSVNLGSVTEIGASAFLDSFVATVTFPDALANIGAEAFASRRVTGGTFTFLGSAPSIAPDAFQSSNGVTVRYPEGGAGWSALRAQDPNPFGVNVNWVPVAAPAPAPTPAPDPEPAPPSTPLDSASASSTPPQVNPSNSPQIPALESGTSNMTIGGQVVQVERETGARGRGVTLSAGPVTMTVRSESPNGRSVPVAPDGSLILARSGEVPIEASGLAPGSVVTQTLFSDPIDLGSAVVDASGSFRDAPKIPANTPLGNHTLSVRGTTNTGDPFTLNIGVTVATPAVALGADPVLTIKPARTSEGPAVNVSARGVQARCMVTFTSGKTSTKVRANAQGLARTTLTPVKARSGRVPVTMRVSGKGCEAITVQGNATVRTLSQV